VSHRGDYSAAAIGRRSSGIQETLKLLLSSKSKERQEKGKTLAFFFCHYGPGFGRAGAGHSKEKGDMGKEGRGRLNKRKETFESKRAARVWVGKTSTGSSCSFLPAFLRGKKSIFRILRSKASGSIPGFL
jgi:hypothetical protein